MSEPDPLTVQCPSCLAPAGEACRSNMETTHADRVTSAQLYAVEHGTCDLCTQPMVRGLPTVGAEVTAWHPDPAHAALCPPMADPNDDWNAYAAQTQQGLEPGRPGLEHFIPEGAALAAPLPLCPECRAGKPQNCAEQALDDHDDLVPCRTTRECDGSCGERKPHALHTEPTL